MIEIWSVGWGTLWGSVALFALLIVLVAYQAVQVARQPLKPLPYPVNRRTAAAKRGRGRFHVGTRCRRRRCGEVAGSPRR